MNTKAYKTELNPNKAQLEFFQNSAGAARVTYNWALGRRNDDYDNKRKQLLAVLDTYTGSATDRTTILDTTTITDDEGIDKFVEDWQQYCEAEAAWVAGGKKDDSPKRPPLKIKTIGFNDLKKEWRVIYRRDPNLLWMCCAPASVIDYAFINLYRAFCRWFDYLRLPPDKRVGVPKVGKPKFKKRGRGRESFSLLSSVGVIVEERRIKLPNIKWVRLKERDYIPVGRSKKQVTVSSAVGRWFVSVMGEVIAEPLPEGRPAAGVDVGIVDYAIIHSDQSALVERVSNPKHLDAGLRRLRMLNRRVSRKMGPRSSGGASNRWKKAMDKVRRQHYHIANRRANHQHELSTSLVQRFGQISVETLGIVDMMRRRGGRKTSSRWLRRMIGDAAWYEFRRQLTYKGEWYGTLIEAASRWYPSTKECSVCQAITDVNWHDRKCRCTKCGLVIDMDDNAAENLLREMFRSLKQKQTV